MITLKSLVRNDTIDKATMAAKFISVIDMFTTSKLNINPEKSVADTVFSSKLISLVLHLKTPQPKEFIQIKLFTGDGKILSEPTYVEIHSGPDQTQWSSISNPIKNPGKYRVEVYNSQGIEIGRTFFRIVENAVDEISMTENSEFRTMASGSLDAPGKEQTSFKVGQMIHYWFRLNSPKSGEVVTVMLVDSKDKTIWKDNFTTAVNTAKGFRGWRYHGARAPGAYKVILMTGDGDVLAEKAITIE